MLRNSIEMAPAKMYSTYELFCLSELAESHPLDKGVFYVVDNGLTLIIKLNSNNIKPALGIVNILFEHIAFGRADDLLLLSLGEGKFGFTVIFTFPCLHLKKNQHSFRGFGDDVYLPFPENIIPFYNIIVNAEKILHGNVFPAISEFLGYISHFAPTEIYF